MNESLSTQARAMPAPRPPAWLSRLTWALDQVARWSGWAVAWLIIPMVAALVIEVVGRYVFDSPTIWAYDMTYMLYGTFFMVGSAYTLYRHAHIRTDLVYERWSPRTQGVIDVVCYLAFFFPPLVLFLMVGWEYFWVSFQRNERIVTSPWMPIVWPFKFAMPLAAALLLLQGLSEILKSAYAAATGKWP